MNPANLSCAKCRGACCETMVIPITTGQERDWISGRAVLMTHEFAVILSRCSHLTPEGRCDVYETRPEICRQFPVGCLGCLLAIKATGRKPLDLIADNADK